MTEANEPGSDEGGLFRKEAIEHSLSRLDGEIVLATSVPTRVLTVLALAVVVLAGAFVSLAHYTRKETAQGWLALDHGLATVTTRQGGLVVWVGAAEGDIVQFGRPLVSLQTTEGEPQGAAKAEISTALEAEEAALAREFSTGLEELQLQRRKLDSGRLVLLQQAAEIRERITLQEGRLELARRGIERAETLAARGYGSGGAVEARRAEALSIEGELSALRSQALSLRRERSDIDAELAALPAGRARLQATYSSRRTDRLGRAVQLDARTTYRASAPATGMILALPFSKGETAPPGAALAVIMPAGSTLEAELVVPSRAAGFVRPGQQVLLSFSAFPKQRFGAASGSIRSVSRTVLVPSEFGSGRVAGKEAGFRVRVRLDKPFIEANGMKVPLRPGMEVSAKIAVERKSLVAWLLGDLLKSVEF